jgi:AraC-like DNA-binding protein
MYSILHYFLFEGNNVLAIAIFFKHFSPFFYIPGTLLYFYIRRSLHKEEKFNRTDLLHLTPFLIALINISPYFLVPFSEKLEYGAEILSGSDFGRFANEYLIYNFSTSAIIRITLLLGYLLASCYILFKYWVNLKSRPLGSSQKSLFKWLVFLTVTGFIFFICLIFLTFDFYLYLQINKSLLNQFIFTRVAGFTLFIIPFVMFFFPRVVYSVPTTIGSKEDNRINYSELNDDPIGLLGRKILNYFEIDKPFQNPEFSIDDLCKYLGASKNQIYKCLNEYIGEKFTDLRSKYRISHAQKMLESQESEVISLKRIWIESGFSSKTNFFTTFKEITGMTPTEYIKMKKN